MLHIIYYICCYILYFIFLYYIIHYICCYIFYIFILYYILYLLLYIILYFITYSYTMYKSTSTEVRLGQVLRQKFCTQN